MHSSVEIQKNIFWVGGNDRRIKLFENVYPVPNGVSYNSYLILDEKTVLLDTVDKSISDVFYENIEFGLSGRPLDYLVINHMEPDHCSQIESVLSQYPEARVVCNSKTLTMIKQFFDIDISDRTVIVKEGDTLSIGEKTLTFVMAPMVHWPEVMVTYEITTKTLFSADAFGTFGALNGNMFADEVNFERDWINEARRYYANIVGKYGTQVQTLLKKASSLEINMICPLHGPIWRTNFEYFINKYNTWSKYEPEEKGVLIVYASIYGHTANASDILANSLANKGVKNIKVCDVSNTHTSDLISDAFKYSNIVFASATYNAGIFTLMENFLNDLKKHNLQNRTVAFIENGSWAPTSGSLMKEIVSQMKNMTVIGETVTVNSAVNNTKRDEIEKLAEEIAKTIL